VTPGSGRLRALAALGLALTLTGAGMRGSAGPADLAPAAPTNLRVDEAAAPLWVTGAPTFGWIPSDPDRGEIQTAYRIIVANAPTTDAKSRSVLWDSGRVASGNEAFVSAPGLHLSPDHRYWRTVQTWDRAGSPGPFARPVPFDTALDDGDWHADWIRRSTRAPSPFEDFVLFRKRFVAGAGTIVRARAYVAASQQYELFVNGERVDAGPSYSYPDEQYYQATDITKLLKPGVENVVAMIVHNLGGGQGRPPAPPGLIAHITVDHGDGSRQVITTDATWLWHPGPWLPGTPRNDEGDFVENIDGRLLPPGWASPTFDDRAWPRAQVIGRHPTNRGPISSRSGRGSSSTP
jgi:alpha-L-rhamnosidase